MRPRATVPESAVEFFPSLEDIQFVRHGFIGRIPGIDVATDRAEALARLDETHRAVRAELDLGETALLTAEQVHGSEVAVIPESLGQDRTFAGVDGLVTNRPGVSLGIYVADCCAVFLVDPVHKAIGLVHSGKKGTELAIVETAIGQMREQFDSAPRDLIAQLSPCIRPPHYEVDFASEIVRQARGAGVQQVHDGGICTASDLSRYYSYRAEKGRTGRMLALLSLR
jgi:purine-nucleoside/S-methyl-5'-thioadenosine phosphorylase / adenosine deaminase